MILENKKQMKLALFIVFILFILSIVIVLKLKPEDDSTNDISISYSNSGVVDVDNSLPISDALGKNISLDSNIESSQGIIEFSINNPNDKEVGYDIFLTKEKLNNSIKENYVKLYLTNESNTAYDEFNKNAVPTYNDLLTLNDKPGSKLLYRGKILGNTEDKFVLRVWISDSYALTDNKENFKFNLKVRKN